MALKRGFTATLLLWSALTQAQDLDAQLTTFFAQRLAGFSDEVSVQVRTPASMRPSCETPAFSVLGNTKLWGNVSVTARCGNEKRFIQVAVQATGDYVVASRSIPGVPPCSRTALR